MKVAIAAHFKVAGRFQSSWSGGTRTLGTSGSHKSSGETSTCLAESVGEEVCCAGSLVRILQIGILRVSEERVLRWPPVKACLEFLLKEHRRL